MDMYVLNVTLYQPKAFQYNYEDVFIHAIILFRKTTMEQNELTISDQFLYLIGYT